MSLEQENGFVPRAPRFKVAETSAMTVSIKRTEESNQEPLAAELIDVSQHGAKIRVPVNLRFEEALQLNIDVADSEIEYHGIASVRHIRATEDEHWVVGCAVAPPLSDETFSFLATTAGKERRRFRRLNIAAEATVRRQAQSDGVAASLHNLSSGGFCFSSSDQYEVGEPVQLTLEGNDGDPRLIEARICWQIESPDGCIAGCQFTSSESYAEVCACLTEQPVLASQSKREEPTSKLVLTAAVLAMFLPPMMTLFMQAKKVSAQAETPSTATLVEQTNLEPDCEVQETIEAAADTQMLAELVQNSLATDEEEQSSKASEVNEQQTIQESLVREWVDNTGKYRTLAELVEVTPDHLVLVKPDGQRKQVPWIRLSEADQEFARNWQASKD